MKKEGYWQIDLKIVVNGEEVAIDELSEETRKEIAEKIIDGYCAGEIKEEGETE